MKWSNIKRLIKTKRSPKKFRDSKAQMVKQKSMMSCAIASMAMISGKPYRQIMKIAKQPVGPNEPKKLKYKIEGTDEPGEVPNWAYKWYIGTVPHVLFERMKIKFTQYLHSGEYPDMANRFKKHVHKGKVMPSTDKFPVMGQVMVFEGLPVGHAIVLDITHQGFFRVLDPDFSSLGMASRYSKKFLKAFEKGIKSSDKLQGYGVRKAKKDTFQIYKLDEPDKIIPHKEALKLWDELIEETYDRNYFKSFLVGTIGVD